MIYVTPQAREELCRLLPDKDENSMNSFRLKSLGSKGLSLAIDERKADDDSLEYGGHTVLVYNRDLAKSRNGVSLDAYDTPEGMRFVISREVTRRSHSSVTVNWVTLPQP